MKSVVAILCLVFAAALTHAQSNPVASKAGPGQSSTTKQGVKEKEELPIIPGTEIERPDGTFLGLEVVGGQFKLSFYDKKKKPMTINVTRAVARWNNTRGAGDFRTILNGSGTALVGSKPVFPPFTFIVYLTLLQGEGDEAKSVEHYVTRVSN